MLTYTNTKCTVYIKKHNYNFILNHLSLKWLSHKSRKWNVMLLKALNLIYSSDLISYADHNVVFVYVV